MRLSNKIVLIWLAVMWTVFSAWVFIVTSFPLNFGFAGLESISGIVLMWTMIQYKDMS